MPVTDRTLFKRELRAGDIFNIRSGIRAVQADGTLDIASRMVNQDTGVESAAFETRLRWVAADRRSPLPWPEEVRAAAAALAGDLPEMRGRRRWRRRRRRTDIVAWSSPTAARSSPGNAMPTALHRRAPTSRASTTRSPTCSGPWGSTAPTCSLAGSDRRHSTTTSRINGRCAPASGRGPQRPAALGDKVSYVVHYVVDTASGEIITSIVVTALFFDLDARKSVAIPQAVRAEAERLLAGAWTGASPHSARWLACASSISRVTCRARRAAPCSNACLTVPTC